MLSNNPLNPPEVGWGGSIFLGESQSRIYPHMRVKFGRGPTVVSKKGGHRHTDYETVTSRPYVRYNTANKVTHFSRPMSGTILPTMGQILVVIQ